MQKIELKEGPIVQGDGVFGPLMITSEGKELVGLSSFYLTIEDADYALDCVLVHNGPERKPMFVSARDLQLAAMRNE